MTLLTRCCFLASLIVLLATRHAGADEAFAVELPAGVKAVWDLDSAYHETTPTRERLCINGLWRWQPAGPQTSDPPKQNWGYFKVPGCWPGITDYMQKDSQTVFAHPGWKDQRLAGISAAWYEREITIPADWGGRRIALAAEYVNSLAEVFIDGQRAGELRFPGGELDLSSHCQPGAKHVLSLRVVALPLRDVLTSYNDTATARQARGNVARRGLCGDCFLVSTPAAARITDVKIDTSVRKGEISFAAALDGLAPPASYVLLARVTSNGQPVRELRSQPFQASELKDGRITLTDAWKPGQLWDVHTPQHQQAFTVSLADATGKVLDTSYAQRFGFREFWIDGKDFYLNGSRIYLSAVPLDNAQIGAALSNYKAAAESLQRLKSIGINFVYTHNYGCQPGDHLSFAEILRAADDVGMLVALSQPHFSHYDWQAADADVKNGYAHHAEFYVRQAQNHPAVVAYSMSHNACGYGEDMNPDMIDGRTDPRKSPGELNNVARALRAEAIVKRFDPARIVYHHAGGNIGAMHTINFYPNFVPIQEMSDWFEHWATTGVKPAFTCEYGAPFSWDWAMYRGWYNGERSFGSARVPWDFCLAEWNAQFFGDRAFQTSEFEKNNLRYEAKQLAAAKAWNRWDYPHDLNSKLFDERYPIIAQYLTDNWRAFRTWGVSAISAWEHGMYWKLRDGVDRSRKDVIVDWDRLQRPGLSPDYIGARYERMDLAFDRSDWVPTPAAEALLRNNLPLLAYIAGRPAAFTSKNHLFLPGQAVEKQLIVINNSRQPVTCESTWSLELPRPVSGSKHVTVPTGDQARIPLELKLPAGMAPGEYQLRASFKFADGQTQDDAFTIRVMPQPRDLELTTKIALFDPRGQTSAWLSERGVKFATVAANADLSPYDVLIIGKAALTAYGAAPDVSRVRDGLRVLVFEQTADALEKRLGFRVAEYGLRQAFPRVPDHPLLVGLSADELRDWRGEATLNPPRLKYETRPRFGPTVKWCGLEVPHLWRCGNRGNVASVLIEKPARGDFLPIVDGGYSLQYSPLLEFREGRGMILFCQLDVTGRTEIDPAAETLARNLLRYVSEWKPTPRRAAIYAGDPHGKRHLESAGFTLLPYEPAKLAPQQVLVMGPGSGKLLNGDAAAITAWLQAGGHLLGIGLTDQDLQALPFQVTTRKAEHISAYFDLQKLDSPLRGAGPPDVHNRDPKELTLIAAGPTVVGDGVLATAENGRAVFCQLAPWDFANSKQPNHRKTFRRTSFLVTRLLANLGVSSSTPLLDRLHQPVNAAVPERRWLDGLYLDQPQEWDDPYRFFRW